MVSVQLVGVYKAQCRVPVISMEAGRVFQTLMVDTCQLKKWYKNLLPGVAICYLLLSHQILPNKKPSSIVGGKIPVIRLYIYVIFFI